MPRRTLGEAIAWQPLAPLILATVVALFVGVNLIRVTGTSVTASEGQCTAGDCAPGSAAWHSVKITMQVPVPYPGLLLLGAAAIAGVVGVGLIFLRMSTDLEELRVG